MFEKSIRFGKYKWAEVGESFSFAAALQKINALNASKARDGNSLSPASYRIFGL